VLWGLVIQRFAVKGPKDGNQVSRRVEGDAVVDKNFNDVGDVLRGEGSLHDEIAHDPGDVPSLFEIHIAPTGNILHSFGYGLAQEQFRMIHD
ncbi:MAG: hypothetical protein UT02_C0003G0026, partial [Parcubacteria group bacterium GW2011_GWC2_38_7]